MNSFLSIFRNCYLRTLIRNNVFRDTVIDIPSLEYLNDNHQFLAVFSNDDKLQYKIYIRLSNYKNTSVRQFKSNSHRHLINDIDTYYWNIGKKTVDLSIVHDRVHRVSIYIEKDSTTIKGKLPQSIAELHFHSNFSYGMIFCLALEPILSDLPKNLRLLSLSQVLNISSSSSRIQLPDSIVDLQYSASRADLDRFVGNLANKVLKNTILQVSSIEDLQWLQDKLWINKLFIKAPISHQIPSHVRSIEYSRSVSDSALLESLPVQLESLDANRLVSNKIGPVSKLIKQFVPCLKHLWLVNFDEDLQKDIFPECLEFLKIDQNIKDIGVRVLPSNLKRLDLPCFNQELEIGLVPNSITHLSFTCFNQPLQASVLPPQLQCLSLFTFNQRIEPNSLPLSLTVLHLDAFSGSFQHVGTLDNLRELTVGALNQSMAAALVNVKTIKITVLNTIDTNTSLTNTSITDLCLYNLRWYQVYKISDNFLPSCLVKLVLYNFDLQSINTIPPSCLSFKYSSTHLDTNLIPETVKNVSALS
ncbi:hypothetical protein CYY_000226 [Polysphondylium violaceum]|uniref:Uncharacterized protein n=1 Tax=Polysphondylium violaceum TaxID=133409 RepID=A0A8J4QBD9_9MYCE|nr:hypothetical protein CYY_000226 [Polysphondylium violaceum]